LKKQGNVLQSGMVRFGENVRARHFQNLSDVSKRLVMTNKWIKLILACVLFGVPVLLIVGVFFFLNEVGRIMLTDADMCWVEDNTRGFIWLNKRMPENWDELANQEQTFSHPPIGGIESRVEVNFDIMRGVNAGNRELLPPFWSDARKKMWIYRFNWDSRRPKNQDRIMADFFYQLYLSQRAPVPCEHCSANESNENHEQCVP